MEFLFNSEYFKIFWSTYFEEHMQMAASENFHKTSDYGETEKH